MQTSFRNSLMILLTLLAFSALGIPSAQADWMNVGAAGFSAGQADDTSLALDGSGTPYVAYTDYGNSNKATVMKFNGSDWVNVGTAGFSADGAYYISLALDGSGNPYVAYMDNDNSYKATVMKFNGTSWVNVGAAGFSAGGAYYPRIALDGSGTPYVAYQDGGTSFKATVMKFNGSDWVNVGAAGFSADQAEYMSLALDGSGNPFVAYKDGGHTGKATVMKFNGASWVNVGAAGFSAGQADYASLALDGSSTPFVAYSDTGNGFKATVMKFNGTSWVNVGAPGFSAGLAYYTSLALDVSGTPFVAFQDHGNFNYATVMKFDGSDWVNVGTAGFSANAASYTSLALDGSGTPYVAFQDGGSKATVMKSDGVSTTSTTSSIAPSTSTTSAPASSTTTSSIATTTSSISTTTSSIASTTSSIATTTSSIATTTSSIASTSTTTAAPVVDFTATPVLGPPPLEVTFSASGANAAAATWNFGDTTTGSGAGPSHTYQTAGTYDVTLTVPGAGPKTRAAYIKVVANAPLVSFTASKTEGAAPLTVNFTDTSTGTITSRLWQFGDGATQSSATPVNPSHTYAAAGEYTVILTVTGPGGTVTATQAISAQESPRTHDISGTITGIPQGPVTVSLTGPDLTRTVKTDAGGSYTVSAIPNGTYTVTPIQQGLAFDPPSTSALVLGGSNLVPTMNASSSGDPYIYLVSGPTSIHDGGSGILSFMASAGSTVTATLADGRPLPVYAVFQPPGPDGLCKLVVQAPPGMTKTFIFHLVARDSQGRRYSTSVPLKVEYISAPTRVRGSESVQGSIGVDTSGLPGTALPATTAVAHTSITPAIIASPGKMKAAAAATPPDCWPTITLISPSGIRAASSGSQSTLEIGNEPGDTWTWELESTCEGEFDCQLDFRIASLGMVSGLVVDAATGAVIDGAQLETTGGISSQTESGAYAMAHPAGAFSLSVSKEGYVTAQQSLTVTDGGQAEVNIALVPVGSDGGCLLRRSLPAGSPQLQALRRLRDEVLAKSAMGRLAIRLYYGLSPAAVYLIEDNAYLQEEVRAFAGWLAKRVQNK